jgi:3-methyl-2-oxobutanoate hydroxymethyltransferase
MMARLLDGAGVDALLVGDSVGVVMLGYDTTVPVTLDDMVHHTKAVSRGTERAMVIADMPFLTYQVSIGEAVRNAGRLMQEGRATAVKLEGGRHVIDVVRRLVDIGVPVMGHVGLLPQSVHQLGGYRKRGTEPEEADTILVDAHALQDAGAFAIVLESIPDDLARAISSQLEIPHHRHRRRARLRWPGAGQFRTCWPDRRPYSVVRQAVRWIADIVRVAAVADYVKDVRVKAGFRRAEDITGWGRRE